MLLRIKTFGSKNASIPRLFLIVLLIIFLFYKVWATHYLFDVFLGFLISMFLFELLRLNEKCIYDVVSFLNIDIRFLRINLVLFVVEVFSPKIFALVFLFALQNDDSNFIPILAIGYLLLIYFQIHFGLFGIRSKLFSQTYVWLSLIGSGVLFSLLNVFGQNSNHSILKERISIYFHEFAKSHFYMSLIITLAIIIMFIVVMISKKRIEQTPFPDPESFPKKLF